MVFTYKYIYKICNYDEMKLDVIEFNVTCPKTTDTIKETKCVEELHTIRKLIEKKLGYELYGNGPFSDYVMMTECIKTCEKNVNMDNTKKGHMTTERMCVYKATHVYGKPKELWQKMYMYDGFHNIWDYVYDGKNLQVPKVSRRGNIELVRNNKMRGGRSGSNASTSELYRNYKKTKNEYLRAKRHED